MIAADMSSKQTIQAGLEKRIAWNLRSFWSACKSPLVRVPLLISLACALVMLFSFHYSDTDAFLSWSTCFWDCVFRQTDLEFYTYTATYPRGAEAFLPCNLSVLMMLPLAIWDFPVWLAHVLTGDMNVNGVFDVIWFKLLLLMLMVICTKLCFDIAQMVAKDERNVVVIPLVFGSATLLMSTMYASQDEILYMVTFLCCIKKLFEKKDVPFFAYAAVTIALSNEMILPVFLLLVLRERLLIKAFGLTILAALPALIVEWAYHSNGVYQATKQELGIGDAIHMLFARGTGFTQYVGDVSYLVPVFVSLIVVLFFFAYTSDKSGKESESGSYRFRVVWFVALLMTSMSVLISGTMLEWFYRACLYAPFLAIVICTSKQNIKTNLTLLVIFEYVKAFICLATNPSQNMSTRYLSDPVIEILGGSVEPFSIYEKLSSMPVISNLGIWFAVLIGVMIILFVINNLNNDFKQIKSFHSSERTLLIGYSSCMPLIIIVFVSMLTATLIL